MRDRVRSVTEKQWLEFEVDGKVIAVLEGSAATRESNRLKNLIGIVVREATPESLIRFRAITVLPCTVLRKFEEAVNLDARKRRIGWQSSSRPSEGDGEDD